MHKPLFPSPSVYNATDHQAYEKSHESAVKIKHGVVREDDQEESHDLSAEEDAGVDPVK